MKHWHQLRLQNEMVYVGIDEQDSLNINELETFSAFLSSLDKTSCTDFQIQEHELGIIDGSVYAWNQLNYEILNAMANEIISKINITE